MQRKYFIQTFGCQMNQADSEKINMILLQSGFLKSSSLHDSDLVIFNTCSVRQKWEDRVFWMLREIEKLNILRKKEWKNSIVTGITGCMVRKTGIAKKYLKSERKKRKTAKKIDLLSSEKWIYNFEDKLFPRSKTLDFTLRIEETKYLIFILSEIYNEKIGQEDKFDDYLKQIQQRENPSSASIIIQTGCDNYCSFCIVPFTRWKEISRDKDEILNECKEAVQSWAKEITLLGQNVNSYGKQNNLKLWNIKKSKWNDTTTKLKIGIDLDDTLFIVLCQEIIDTYNTKYNKIMKLDDIVEFNMNGIPELMAEYHNFEKKHALDMNIHPGGENTLKKLKSAWHSFYIITSRPPKERKTTEKLLIKYFWENFFEEIIFIQESGEDLKYKAANKLGLDIVIDDGAHHIEAYSKHFTGKICIFHQMWNRHLKEDNSQLYRIYDWNDFEKLLPKLRFTSPFRKLLEWVSAIDWIDRIRFTSSNPHDMTQDILDAHFEVPHMCNYLHFALQSGNNEMLKRMNRRHSYEDFRNMVQYLRKKDPLFSISTDIIVGFSGETDEMFEDTIQAFKDCVFDFAYIARYSVRPHTLASKIMPDNVADTIKSERWHTLNELLLENIQKRNILMLWRKENILISGEKDDFFFWRTRNFKEVFVEKTDTHKIGDIIAVKITELDRYVLKGLHL